MNIAKDSKLIIQFAGEIGTLIRLQTDIYGGEPKGSDTIYFLSDILHHLASFDPSNNLLFELIQRSISNLINNEVAMKLFGTHEYYATSVLQRGLYAFSNATATIESD